MGLVPPVLRSAGARGASKIHWWRPVMYPTAERLLERCDAVLRLPGEPSRGADQDVAIARRRGTPGLPRGSTRSPGSTASWSVRSKRTRAPVSHRRSRRRPQAESSAWWRRRRRSQNADHAPARPPVRAAPALHMRSAQRRPRPQAHATKSWAARPIVNPVLAARTGTITGAELTSDAAACCS